MRLGSALIPLNKDCVNGKVLGMGALPPALAGLPRDIIGKRIGHARRTPASMAARPLAAISQIAAPGRPALRVTEVSRGPAAKAFPTESFKRKLSKLTWIRTRIERQTRPQSGRVIGK